MIPKDRVLISMPKKRVALSKTTEKRAFQEANSKCGFCEEREIASLQIHHMDSDPANNMIGNLLVVCATCHTKITGGVISEADVLTKKREIEWLHVQMQRRRDEGNVNVNITGSSFRGDIARTITKITTARPPRITHPPDSIGADLQKKGYIDYLITQYFKFRKADKSFGNNRRFSHAEIHTTIQSEFGHKTFFIPAEFFERLSKFLQFRIDRTILGKRNTGCLNPIPNYHSYQEHLSRHCAS